jgi:methyl-accepting chemotaxis protein
MEIPGMDGQGQLNRSDLLLMMESYKNSVEMYTIIMEQLKRITESLETIANQQKDMVSKQRVTCDNIGKISDNLNSTLVSQKEAIKDMLDRFEDTQRDTFSSLVAQLKEGSEKLTKKVESIDDDIQSSVKDYIRDQGTMKVRFNRVYAALSGVIIGLIGAVATAYTKMLDLHEIIDIVTKIANHLNIVIK